ncbi:MAG TPA: bifunctional metallophosphatase/5'-nucleotidase [Polyangiaceae bacterium LLY-WYZ-15_(1-7)]|nr:bifunctional metallophosphatase/5'-nucleotidase [Polyangiaceae bacterium LLY-WYZ-15_(1-7)]HJL07720.1 bifunctional metallophosphatase/5'-nucleotidase [Polyangiaceae bacterium LLY-WYZ-15_(1-7)]HJL25346.1 bifunctional metallophosphatase/5'-nucleotidase [Polyangiaceae bacterium LLY-WYZ-15_(1-7)]HJL28319.1 bifunctional metallophosphatase/5'-nucleotidase [Polyangiaceae bacterium LLY-WYZ-15_(1-7)]HJL39101.1 bifunctional metallophosphatase/5'-nucleotidase [Polyangiaceae bacterium LLY-WYZ-15_(1-7)]
MNARGWGLFCAALLAACGGDDDATMDAGTDGGATVDAGAMEDAGSASDAGPDLLELQLLGINDFHGRLRPPSGTDLGGAAYLATHVAAREEANPNTLFLSAGDLVGGSAFLSGVLHDEPTIAVMNAIGLDAAGDGNHEHDRPVAELARLFEGGCHPDDGCFGETPWEGADFPLLAANVQSATAPTLFDRFAMQRVDGVSVGIVGVTYASTGDDILPAHAEGVEFSDEVAAINAVVPELLEMGAETIVALVHAGGRALAPPCESPSGPIFDLVPELHEAVDVVFSGHTHTAYLCEVDGRVVTAAGRYGELFSDVDLQIDRATGDVVGHAMELVPVSRDVTPDAEVQAILDGYEAGLEDPVVGTITADLTRTPAVTGRIPMGLVVADAFLARNEDAVMAFQNSGGVREALLHAASGDESEDGQVRRSELYATTPFSNQLLTISVTGAELKAFVEEQFTERLPTLPGLQPSAGVEIRFDASRDPGFRVLEITLDGVALDDEATYRVTTNDFVLGRSTVLAEPREEVYLGSDLEALVAYFEGSSPIAPPEEARLVAVD